jgi:hypothetical protein
MAQWTADHPGCGATETRLRDNVAVAYAVAVGPNLQVTGFANEDAPADTHRAATTI